VVHAEVYDVVIAVSSGLLPLHAFEVRKAAWLWGFPLFIGPTKRDCTGEVSWAT
jgi:hypothetical protein